MSAVFINLQNVRIIQWFLLLYLLHEKYKSDGICEIVVFPFLTELISKVVHSGQSVALLFKDCKSVDWT